MFTANRTKMVIDELLQAAGVDDKFALKIMGDKKDYDN